MYTVKKDGQKFAEFSDRKMAEQYVDMQLRKVRGGGLFVGNLSKFEDSRKANAARGKWTIE